MPDIFRSLSRITRQLGLCFFRRKVGHLVQFYANRIYFNKKFIQPWTRALDLQIKFKKFMREKLKPWLYRSSKIADPRGTSCRTNDYLLSPSLQVGISLQHAELMLLLYICDSSLSRGNYPRSPGDYKLYAEEITNNNKVSSVFQTGKDLSIEERKLFLSGYVKYYFL
jgi:hypothetical protein